MHVTEPQLRTVLLAQAIERADAGRTLVSQVELHEATRAAVAAARQRVQRVGVGDVVLERAAAIVQRASGRDAAVAALQQPGARLRWLARALPVAALLLGLAIDRIANAHRVDLLSPPLLIVLGWNLAMYLLLAWRACRPSGQGAGALAALRHWALARAGRRSLATRIAADFHAHWLERTADLFLQRAARVLHLCAAAWGAGIALSLLLRGLVVRYQFGWESTFLDAEQVHAIVSVLFWPLTALFGLAPFTLQEIAATQNFAGDSGAGALAGSRWVWMYVGLLTLAVVLPRLALAAWARWREAQGARQCRIDLEDAAFDALRHSLPHSLVIGLQGPQAQALQGAAVQTAQGDHLQFAQAANPSQPVDAVLSWGDDNAPLPPAWQSAPVLPLRWEDFGESWVLEPTLFAPLEAALPASRHALARLRAAWVERNEERFEQSLQALAQHLRRCTTLEQDADRLAHYAEHVQALDDTLRALHGQGAAPLPAAPGRSLLPAPLSDEARLAMGTSVGAIAGAGAGAKVGALIDIGTGGLTLGAGTALGALLGGTTAWVVRSFQKKEEQRDVLRHAAEAACTHYLVIAHQARIPARDAAGLAHRWRAEVTGAVAAHEAELAAALKAPADATTLPALLRTLLLGILQRSFGQQKYG